MEPESFRLNLNNLIQSLRNVTWLLQKQKVDFPDFAEWYGTWQRSVAQDSIMRWIVKSRNRIVKEADLELLSRARIRVSLDWVNEVHMNWTMPPRYTTREILIRLLSTQAIPPVGILTIERRWIDQKLPDSELLDACAYAYRNISHVIATAHAKAEVQLCDLPDRNMPCVKSKVASRPECMYGGSENRILHINLETRAEVTERIEVIPDSVSHDRYGKIRLTGDAIARVPQIIEVNKRMLMLDGGLATVAIFMRGDRAIDTLGLDFYDQGSKRVALHKVADWAERYDADGVIFVAEAWLTEIGPEENPTDPPKFPARAGDNRMEAITVAAITRDGRSTDSVCMFTREQDGKIVFDETLHDVGQQVNALEPVRRRWRETPSA
jgi:hypothetical protein